VWDVTSTLVAVDLPMGADVLPAPNKAAVKRAEQEDLNKPMRYQVGFASSIGRTWGCCAESGTHSSLCSTAPAQ
jgi:hypothetical protein